jgi:autotransporter-associated beta strand protein
LLLELRELGVAAPKKSEFLKPDALAAHSKTVEASENATAAPFEKPSENLLQSMKASPSLPSAVSANRLLAATFISWLGMLMTSSAQQNVFSRDNSNTNLWWNDNPNNKPWFYSNSSDQNRPDNFIDSTNRHNVFIGHNFNTTMSVNGAFFQLRTLTLQGGATSNRTFNTVDGGGISLSVGLTNDSSGSHNFNVPIGVDGTTVSFASNNGALTFSNSFFLNANTAEFTGSNASSVTGQMSGSGGKLNKTGAGTLTLSGNNNYTGTTIVNAGTLVVNGNQTNATGNVTVHSKLAGTGTLGGATTISGTGTLAPTAQASGNRMNIANSLTFSSGSIFEWNLNAVTSDPGVNIANSGSYGQLAATGAATGTSVFNIVLGSNAYADAFWNTNKSWNNVFSASGLTALNSLFTTFSGAGLTASGSGATAIATASGRGHFSFSGTTLQWTAVPEPTSALAGLLLGAGLLRRRRA